MATKATVTLVAVAVVATAAVDLVVDKARVAVAVVAEAVVVLVVTGVLQDANAN